MAGPYVDEHGSSTGLVPEYVSGKTLPRWLFCSGLAQQFTGKIAGDPEQSLFAQALFRSNLKTGDPALLPPEQLEEAEIDRWRNRLGEFIDMPDRPDAGVWRRQRMELPPPPSMPEPKISAEEIKALGLDKPPKPGPAALKLLGDYQNTHEMYAAGAPIAPKGESPDPFYEVPYKAERKPQHDAWVDGYFEGKTPPPLAEGELPRAVITAGGPASGKTTTVDRMANKDMGDHRLLPPEEHTIRIDVDDVKTLMDEYNDLKAANDPYAASAVHMEAGDVVGRIMREATEKGFHVVLDQTGDGPPGHFERILRWIHGRGYSPEIVYVNVPTDQAVALAVQRALEDGRWVPIPVVRRQHQRVSRNFVEEVVGLTIGNEGGFIRHLEVLDRGEVIAHLDDEGRLLPLNRARFAAFVAKREEKPDE